MTVETAIDPATGECFRCVFDAKTCLPVEPIQRFLNYCRKRGLAANTVETYAYRLVDYWRWLEYREFQVSNANIESLIELMVSLTLNLAKRARVNSTISLLLETTLDLRRNLANQ